MSLQKNLELLFAQAFFCKEFFEKNPQCRGCDHVDVLVMDYEIYNRTIKNKYCENCSQFKKG